MDSSVSVLKFGGTSVGNGERIRHVAHIIANKLRDREEAFPIVVVSAMSGVTDQLLRIAQYAWAQQYNECEQELSVLKQRHVEAAEKAVHNPESRRLLLHELFPAFMALEQDIATVGAQCIAPAIQGILVSADPSFRSKDAKQCFNLYEEQYYEE